jgi:hypothetical protein
MFFDYGTQTTLGSSPGVGFVGISVSSSGSMGHTSSTSLL